MPDSILTAPKLKESPRSPYLCFAVAVWGMVSIAGILQVIRYKFAPCDFGITAPIWPNQTSLKHDASRPSLVLFTHPHCACTRASLEEFARVISRHSTDVSATVIIDVSDAAVADLSESDAWKQASQIFGVRVIADRSGQESRVFGVKTSGHTLLYSAAGNLLFSGGITGSRGHSGDNLGRSRLEGLLQSESSTLPARHAVFGCMLSTRNSCCRGVGEAIQ